MKKRLMLGLGVLLTLSVNSLADQNATTDQNITAMKIDSPSYEVIIKIPEVPEVPKVEAIVPKVTVIYTNGEKISNDTIEYIPKKRKKEVIFSDHVAPAKYAIKKDTGNDSTLEGDVKNGRVSAYLHAPLTTVKEAKETLKKAGFKVLATYKVDKRGEVTSIVFTNKAMVKAASKKMRGFASNLRLVVDTKNEVVNISNPIYVLGAYMQKDYDKKFATDTLKQIVDNFPGIKGSEEIVKFKVLERYHFMENMPFYQDMKVIKKGSTKKLLAKAKKSKKIIYQQKLANGAIILGVKLGKRTSKFVKKTGYRNSGLLPYPVLIENGEAKIMAPQYYIALMYPMLKMSQFMTIATVPGAITKDMDRIFR